MGCSFLKPVKMPVQGLREFWICGAKALKNAQG
jgi:hypothetical protein